MERYSSTNVCIRDIIRNTITVVTRLIKKYENINRV